MANFTLDQFLFLFGCYFTVDKRSPVCAKRSTISMIFSAVGVINIGEIVWSLGFLVFFFFWLKTKFYSQIQSIKTMEPTVDF